MSEVWKQHPDFPHHEISDQGRIRIKDRIWAKAGIPGAVLRGYKTYQGYIQVRLKDKDGKTPLKRVHRLVLETFVGPCPKGCEGTHRNGKRDDNRLDNLTWKTPAENQADRVAHGTSNRGERNPMFRHGNYAKVF